MKTPVSKTSFRFNNAPRRLRTLGLITRGVDILPDETFTQEDHA